MNQLSLTNRNSIFIGETQVQQYFRDLKKELQNNLCFILVDENTESFCLPLLLKKAPFLSTSVIINITSGEIHKNLDTCKYVWDVLTKHGAERNSILINLGGGVICDMGGFIASAFKRGINFINIPTTLLSMTDASFGGKTGIDFNSLKNQLGVFSSAKAVCILSEFLESLSKRQIINGYAEIVKHALISDLNYWNKIKTIDPAKNTNWDAIIEESVKIKLSITEQDPLEKNIRKTLNFGHTIGHAIESWSLENDTNPLLHGEAIAIGMFCEAYLSNKSGMLTDAAFNEISNYIFHTFPEYILPENSYEKILKLMLQDKKNNSGKINFSLLSSIGTCDINNNCSEELSIESIKWYSSKTKEHEA